MSLHCLKYTILSYLIIGCTVENWRYVRRYLLGKDIAKSKVGHSEISPCVDENSMTIMSR